MDEAAVLVQAEERVRWHEREILRVAKLHPEQRDPDSLTRLADGYRGAAARLVQLADPSRRTHDGKCIGCGGPCWWDSAGYRRFTCRGLALYGVCNNEPARPAESGAP